MKNRAGQTGVVGALPGVLILLIALMLAGPAGAVAAPEEAPAAGGDERLMIQPGDRLEVLIYEDASAISEPTQISAEVDARGRIFLPMVGKVQAAGMLVSELEAEVRDRLSRIVERPLVFIRAEFQRGLVAYLLGEVSEQGAYPVLEEMRVSEFIAKYGGVNTGAADLSEVRVLTEEGEVYRVDLEEILDGDVESDLKVHPGDRIFVPEEGVSGLDRTLRVAQLVSLLFQIATIAIVLAQ